VYGREAGAKAADVACEDGPLHDRGVCPYIEIGKHTALGAAAALIVEEHFAGEKKCFTWDRLNGEEGFGDRDV